MNLDFDALRDRFDKSLFVLTQNLGPQLIHKAGLGLTPGQVFMLYFIREERRCSVTRLAERLEVAPSAITVMLDRLENHGFVFRTRDQADRRVVLIELTEAGEEKLNRVLAARGRILQHCLAQVELAELFSCIQTLEKLADIAQAMDTKTMIGLSGQEA